MTMLPQVYHGHAVVPRPLPLTPYDPYPGATPPTPYPTVEYLGPYPPGQPSPTRRPVTEAPYCPYPGITCTPRPTHTATATPTPVARVLLPLLRLR